MQDRLQSSVSALDTPSLETRLRGQMGEYLHATNTKLGVYRDVIIEKDYNPMRSHSATIRIPTGAWFTGWHPMRSRTATIRIPTLEAAQ